MDVQSTILSIFLAMPDKSIYSWEFSFNLTEGKLTFKPHFRSSGLFASVSSFLIHLQPPPVLPASQELNTETHTDTASYAHKHTTAPWDCPKYHCRSQQLFIDLVTSDLRQKRGWRMGQVLGWEKEKDEQREGGNSKPSHGNLSSFFCKHPILPPWHLPQWFCISSVRPWALPRTSLSHLSGGMKLRTLRVRHNVGTC